MLLIRCPWCGPRDEVEFHYGGEAHVAYPGDPEDLDDRAWSRFVFYRANARGPFLERWSHQHGCRRWFNVVRDTSTHAIAGSYRLDERPEDAR